MKVYASIDLTNSQVVRLYQGKFDNKTVYKKNHDDVIKLLDKWISQGVKDLHIVDLDASICKKTTNIDLAKSAILAKDQNPLENTTNFDLIKKILNTFHKKLNIQVAGGLKSLKGCQLMLDLGADRVVMGSLAVTNAELCQAIIQKFSDHRVTIACDVKTIKNHKNDLCELSDYKVYIKGWQENSNISLDKLISNYKSFENLVFLVTDIKKDGTLTNPNFDLYQKLTIKYPGLKFLVSGGVSEINDVKKSMEVNAYGCIIGKAVHEQCFSFLQLFQELNEELKGVGS